MSLLKERAHPFHESFSIPFRSQAQGERRTGRVIWRACKAAGPDGQTRESGGSFIHGLRELP